VHIPAATPWLCVCVRERECVCGGMRERERDKRHTECTFLLLPLGCVYVCVCVCVRERERERGMPDAHFCCYSFVGLFPCVYGRSIVVNTNLFARCVRLFCRSIL